MTVFGVFETGGWILLPAIQQIILVSHTAERQDRLAARRLIGISMT